MTRQEEAPLATDPAEKRRVLSLSNRLTIVTVAGIVVLDQVTKALVNAHLPLHASTNVIPGLLDVTHVRNTGAAFGLLNAADFPFKSTLMTLIATVALIAIAVYAARSSTHGRLERTGLVLVLGGAIGNLIDRVTVGYVIDFVDVYWRGYHFWAFNVADSAITVGAAFLILDRFTTESYVSEAV